MQCVFIGRLRIGWITIGEHRVDLLRLTVDVHRRIGRTDRHRTIVRWLSAMVLLTVFWRIFTTAIQVMTICGTVRRTVRRTSRRTIAGRRTNRWTVDRSIRVRLIRLIRQTGQRIRRISSGWIAELAKTVQITYVWKERDCDLVSFFVHVYNVGISLHI